VVATLQRLDHVVGFLGDGTNDALALRQADVGISVDSGLFFEVDVIRFSSHTLVCKDALVLQPANMGISMDSALF
jgi:Mg2+-importing ATPase